MALFIRMGDVELINLDNVTRIEAIKYKDKDVLKFYFTNESSRAFYAKTTLQEFVDSFRDLVPYYQSAELA